MARELNAQLRQALTTRDLLLSAPYPLDNTRLEWAMTLALIAVSNEIKVHCRLGRQRETRRAATRAVAPPQTARQAIQGSNG